MSKLLAFAVLPALVLTAACSNQDNPLRVKRSVCPAAGVLLNTGDVTLFSPVDSRDANAIDVSAAITDVRSGCSDQKGSATVTNSITFDVVAQRRQTQGARDVTLPWFAAVIRAGDKMVSKQVGQVTLHFADGQARALATASARADVARSATKLPEAVAAKLSKARRPTDLDAVIDPMSNPETRDAVRNASFELVVGFQLTPSQLAYNVSK